MKVPVIKFYEKYSKQAVDVTFNHKGSKGVKVVKELLAQIPGLRELAFVVRVHQFFVQALINRHSIF